MYLFLVFLLTLTNIFEIDGNSIIPISSPPLLGEGSRPAEQGSAARKIPRARYVRAGPGVE